MQRNDRMRVALTIAGSDSGGGAGIQADLKTFQMLGVFGTSAVTAVTAQNTLGVRGVYPIPPEGVAAQIDAVLEDLGADAAKTGMLVHAELIAVVAERVRYHRLDRLVVDPVMVAKGGTRLLEPDAERALRDLLLPLAFVVTPNAPEAEALTGLRVTDRRSQERAAEMLVRELGARAAVVKGGHLDGPPVDVLFDGREWTYLEGERIATRHTHGTGCTFSAALAAELAKGRPLDEAVRTAKAFVTAAVRRAPGIGGGHGPINHWAYAEDKR